MKNYDDLRNKPDARNERDDEYGKRMEDMADRFKETVRQEKNEVRDRAREAKSEVKDVARQMKDEAKDELKKVKDRRETYGQSAAADLDWAQEMNKEVKSEIADESARVRGRIDDRRERFDEGLERIEKDITTDAGLRNSETSPMDAHGNYLAGDVRGTVNNYVEQVAEHTRRTNRRMQEDVQRAADTLAHKVNKIDR